MRPAKKVGRDRKSYAVFVSHSSRDAWIAEVIAEKIAVTGAKLWLDEKDLTGGAVLIDDIIQGIDDADEALVIVSPASINSEWVMFEIGAARGQHKRITPILNHTNHDAIKTLRDVKAIDLNEFNNFLSQLKKRVRKKRGFS